MGAYCGCRNSAAPMIPIAACGGGRHHVIDTADLAGAAAVYLMYNGSTDCVVTWKTKVVGTKTYTDALIWSEDDSLRGDPRSTAADPHKAARAALRGGMLAERPARSGARRRGRRSARKVSP